MGGKERLMRVAASARCRQRLRGTPRKSMRCLYCEHQADEQHRPGMVGTNSAEAAAAVVGIRLFAVVSAVGPATGVCGWSERVRGDRQSAQREQNRDYETGEEPRHLRRLRVSRHPHR